MKSGVLQNEATYLRNISRTLQDRFVFKRIDPTITTAVHASGDVLFEPVEVTDVARENGGTVMLDTVKIIDQDEESVAIDLLFLKSDVDIGGANAAATVPDASNSEYLGLVKVVASDYTDLGEFTVAEKTNLLQVFETDSDSTSVWVAGIVRATPTYAAATDIGVILNFRRA